MLMKIPDRIQGTDGIRGRIATDEVADGRSPLAVFLEDGFLTPGFFECYVYAWGVLLKSSGIAKVGDRVVIGWDPRDVDGRFNQAALRGLRRSGLTAIQVGVLPTPGIPLYMLSIEAAGGVVLTASHNPSDQNGIKLFHGWTALKNLPADDCRLTEIISGIRDLERIPETGGWEDHEERARRFFIDFHRDRRNAWLDDGGATDHILILDASRGAVAGVLEAIFSACGARELILTNQSGPINQYCGVADLEGLERIHRREVMMANGRFQPYETLRRMFEKADQEPAVSDGRYQLTGLVFDGDGDRCFRLDYHPLDDVVLVSTGDQLGIHQARYLRGKPGFKAGRSTFVSTVESDLNTAITAQREGYVPVVTGVGDKWLLLEAVSDLIRSTIDPALEWGAKLKAYLERTDLKAEWSGLTISQYWQSYRRSAPVLSTAPSFRFRLGIEESGHSLSAGYLPGEPEGLPCFAGNGIKSGLNVLAACHQTYPGQGVDRNAFLSHPFPAGIRQTFYVYFVDKSRLMPDSVLRRELGDLIQQTIRSTFPVGFSTENVVFPEEADMLYYRVLKEEVTCGAIFVRNSGTEDKAALYLRGESAIEPLMETVGDRVHRFLLKNLKNRASELARFETGLLRTIEEGRVVDDYLTGYSHLPLERLLKEIEFKQGLLQRSGGGLQLTEKGKSLMA
jgi:phosphoglucosamine mutase